LPIVFTALDNEFAASTGDNVYAMGDSSIFDYPPTATNDLTITAAPDDPSPYTFEVGDTYHLSWDGMGGGGDFEATVIRSDPIGVGGDSGHAVVFEMVDDAGDAVQVVWTPEFDLESWYFDNFNGGVSPGFYTADQNPAEYLTYVCFAAGTLISAPRGTVAVERLQPGDRVRTLDHGAQPILWVGKKDVSARADMAPVCFEAGAIGNRRALRLSPQHRVLMRGARVEMMFGVPEVLLPARAFLGLPGVSQKRARWVTYVHLLFERHEIVWAEGAPCESLLLGEMAVARLSPPADLGLREAGALMPEVLAHPRMGRMNAARPVLRLREASALLGRAVPRLRRRAVPSML